MGCLRSIAPPNRSKNFFENIVNVDTDKKSLRHIFKLCGLLEDLAFLKAHATFVQSFSRVDIRYFQVRYSRNCGKGKTHVS